MLCPPPAPGIHGFRAKISVPITPARCFQHKEWSCEAASCVLLPGRRFPGLVRLFRSLYPVGPVQKADFTGSALHVRMPFSRAGVVPGDAEIGAQIALQ